MVARSSGPDDQPQHMDINTYHFSRTSRAPAPSSEDVRGSYRIAGVDSRTHRRPRSAARALERRTAITNAQSSAAAAPRDKNPSIFRAVDGLAIGQSLVLVNDHDLRSLRYQLDAERPNALDWAYEAEGPEEWRVRISRR